MDVSRRSLLAMLGAAALARPPVARAGTPAAKHLVVIFAGGGWDPTYTFDPKPDSAFVDQGEGDYAAFGGGTIWVHANRPSVAEFFAQHVGSASVINGMNVPSVAHGSCTNRVLTGFRDATKPDIGAIVGRELGQQVPIPYLDIGGGARSGIYGADLGYMGRANQLKNLVLPDHALEPPRGTDWHRHFLDVDQTELVRAFVAGRVPGADQARAASGVNARRVDDFAIGQARSHELPDYAEFFEAVDAGRAFTDQIARGAEALRVGLSRAVFLEAGTDFDTHADNVDQASQYELVFAGMLALMETLAATSSPFGGTLIDDTVVLLVSEMGRTPRLNEDEGKDHWPVTSCVLAGAGVQGGRIVGNTNEMLAAQPTDLTTGAASATGTVVQSENVLATILELLGVDTDLHFPGTEAIDALLG